MRDPISVGMLAIDGNFIMKEFHEKPGPRLGFLLHALLNDVLEDPKLNTREELSKRAKKYLELGDKELKALGESGKSAKDKEEEEELLKIRSKYKVT
jgi:hypothetical protein